MITFIIGGARSGKSSFAVSEALKLKGRKAYIASAEALDGEMKERIKKHKKDRGDGWDTYEEPIRISEVLKKIEGQYSVILLDCLTLWLSNLMMNEKNIEQEIENFIHSLFTVHCSLFIVSNEVGMGIVPENEMARRFRDMAGMLNQRVAEIADEVYLVVSGIPVKIK
ncbi:MAG: bifunctional adenosylcobinamide kinase/adenosylcobinamide-phosphate guanylyltransferase [Thermodesulfovibrionales bacterium]|nr:bifunctional adenosylcobinamide kinase/adenosylcobinamide-phosphate guanylyltransferase [Thermodesulfovibrionales bacterium]MDP3111824.1 bifunctional adenosylcobinamide kinase/adenosylcobinamide-phosphate guanylyltransferase [Thermodesulfovibrionales bacterium]